MENNEMDNQQLNILNEEIWKPVKNFERLYTVSNTGKVKNIKNNKILKERDLRGYKRVSLYENKKGHDKRIHRLVGEAFIDNPGNKPEINHKDKNRSNNNVNNLEWVTSKENSDHKNKDGVGDIYKNENNGNAKLSNIDCTKIINADDSINNTTLAKEYNVSRTQIRRIRKGLQRKNLV